MTLLITGGAGFIGSCFVLQRVNAGDNVINLDKLTYSGNQENLDEIKNASNHVFVKGDIGDEGLVRKLLEEYKPDAIINFAAESHVDRSILDPDVFVKTNVLGTEILLRVVKDWWKNLDEEKRTNSDSTISPPTRSLELCLWTIRPSQKKRHLLQIVHTLLPRQAATILFVPITKHMDFRPL